MESESSELTTFGALLRFAIDLENIAVEFYQASAKEAFVETQPTWLDLAQQHQQRMNRLERIRRENLNEMLLEPIADLNLENYAIEAGVPPDASLPDLLSRAVQLEGQAQKFYQDSASKAKSVLAEAARAFTKLAQQNGDLQRKIKSLEGMGN